MRLWHDDIRPAPEGWVWARTNDQAKNILLAAKILRTVVITECSLDHDLGLHDFTEAEIEADPEILFMAGESSETGLDLANWMAETGNLPPKIRIHSWNPDGAKRMAAALADTNPDLLNHGVEITIQPFDASEHTG